MKSFLSKSTLVHVLVVPLAVFPGLVAGQTPSATSTPFSLEQQAMQAYVDKHYLESAHLFDAAFAAGLVRSDAFYNAACSYTLAGDEDKALAYLDRAVQSGRPDPDHMKVDSDLMSLHTNKQFSVLVERAYVNKGAYDAVHHDPDRAAIVTSDIDLFWSAYHKMQNSPHPEEVLQTDYLLPGSPGLKDFVFLRIQSANDLVATIQYHRRYYAAIQSKMLHIKDFAPQIHSSFRKLQQIYPESTFPDVYFVIGRLNSAGTVSSSGLMLGAEMFGKGPNVPMDEFSKWLRTSLNSIDDIPYVVAHELIHFQQNTPKNTLLAAAIHEGSADFIGELISGKFMNQLQYQYGIAHEDELWQQFCHQMHGTDTSRWLYEGRTVGERPPDLGYFVGYRITQAYYEKAADKQKAIREILNFQDADKFLTDSGYATPQRIAP